MTPRARKPTAHRIKPVAPRCRAGVSSLLRLAQPGVSSFGEWIDRAMTSTATARRAAGPDTGTR